MKQEIIAILIALEKLNDCNYGRHVMVYMDHKSLIATVQEDITLLPPR